VLSVGRRSSRCRPPMWRQPPGQLRLRMTISPYPSSRNRNRNLNDAHHSAAHYSLEQRH